MATLGEYLLHGRHELKGKVFRGGKYLYLIVDVPDSPLGRIIYRRFDESVNKSFSLIGQKDRAEYREVNPLRLPEKDFIAWRRVRGCFD